MDADDDLPDWDQLPPADQLWIVALGLERAGGPQEYVLALRKLAEALEHVAWWLAEPPFREVDGG